MNSFNALRGKALAGVRGLGNELSMGALPHLAAAPMVGFNRLAGGGMTYQDALDAARGVLARDQQQFPLSTMGGSALAMATPVGLAKKGVKEGVKKAASTQSKQFEQEFGFKPGLTTDGGLFSAEDVASYVLKEEADRPLNVLGMNLDGFDTQTLKELSKRVTDPEVKRAFVKIVLNRTLGKKSEQ